MEASDQSQGTRQGETSSSLTFIAECQSNLNALSVIVHYPLRESDLILNGFSHPLLEYEVIDSDTSSTSLHSILKVFHPASSTPSRFVLPIKVASGQKGSVPFIGDSYFIKLLGESERRKDEDGKASRSNENLFVPAPLSANDLNRNHPILFKCNSCQNTLIRSSPSSPSNTITSPTDAQKEPRASTSNETLTRYRALPSPHWEELVDAWMCHGDQKLNQSVLRGKEGIEVGSGNGTRLQPNEAWVSDFEITWDSDRSSKGSIDIDLESKMVSLESQMQSSLHDFSSLPCQDS